MKKYDLEYKRVCIKKYIDGQSIESVSRETGVSQGVLQTAAGKKAECEKGWEI